MGGTLTGPYLSDTDQSDEHLGIACTRAGDLGADTKLIYTLARALAWLTGL